MKLLNTTLKGDLFEEKVFKLIKDSVENDKFFVSRKNSRIFWKKAYYSRDREKDIIFDIAVESYLKNLL